MNRNICDNNKCMACGACENICPQKCIVRKKLDTAFLMQKGNECIECGLCERVSNLLLSAVATGQISVAKSIGVIFSTLNMTIFQPFNVIF